jgi:hypothetical protein
MPPFLVSGDSRWSRKESRGGISLKGIVNIEKDKNV